MQSDDVELVAPPAVRSGPSLRAWRNAVLALFAVNGFIVAGWVTRVPQVRSIIHATTAEMGLVLVGLAVGNLAGLLASSHIVARLGASRTFGLMSCTGSALVVVAGGDLALAPSPVALTLALVGCGGAFNIAGVALNISAAASERALGTTVMPLFHAFYSIGTIAGAGLGSVLLLVGVPTTAHLVGLGVLGIVATLALVGFLRPAEATERTGAEQERMGWSERLAAWRDRRVLLIGVTVLGMTFAEGSANDWLSLATVDGHHQRPATGAAVFAVFVTAMTVARLLSGRVIDRFGRVAVLRASAGTAVVGLLLFVLALSVPLAVVGVALWGFGIAVGFPVGISAAADDPRKAPAAIGTVATIGFCGSLVGPPVIGFLGQRFGLLTALILVPVLVAIAGLTAPATRKPAAAAE